MSCLARGCFPSDLGVGNLSVPTSRILCGCQRSPSPPLTPFLQSRRAAVEASPLRSMFLTPAGPAPTHRLVFCRCSFVSGSRGTPCLRGHCHTPPRPQPSSVTTPLAATSASAPHQSPLSARRRAAVEASPLRSMFLTPLGPRSVPSLGVLPMLPSFAAIAALLASAATAIRLHGHSLPLWPPHSLLPQLPPPISPHYRLGGGRLWKPLLSARRS